MEISRHLTLDQCTKSPEALRRGIDNTPNAEQIENLKALGANIYDKVKDKFKDCWTNSIFRSPALNKAIGGAVASQHCKGEAVDIDRSVDKNTDGKNTEVFDYIKDNLQFDQLIAEFPTEKGPSWVHASFKRSGKNRKQILVATAKTAKTGKGAIYTAFTGEEPWYKQGRK